MAHARTYEWNHGLGEVVAALIGAGLAITGLQEHRDLEWQGLPQMALEADGRWRLPPEQRDLVPLMADAAKTTGLRGYAATIPFNPNNTNA